MRVNAGSIKLRFQDRSRGTWRPAPRSVRCTGGRRNPVTDLRAKYGPMVAARLFVTLVRQVRERQIGQGNASFVYQRGVYKDDEPKCGTVVENSAQVIVINEGQPVEEFKQQTASRRTCSR